MKPQINEVINHNSKYKNKRIVDIDLAKNSITIGESMEKHSKTYSCPAFIATDDFS